MYWLTAWGALVWGVAAIYRYGWRDLYADQWRLYEQFVRLPFPENVLFLENGHRPVLPNLLRLVELHLAGGNQEWQLLVGLAFVSLSVLLAFRWLSRDESVAPVDRALAAAIVATGICWLANARMLMHPNEVVHTYLIVLAVVFAGGWLLPRLARGVDMPVAFAIVAVGAVATFSFGPGLAIMPTMAIVAWAMRAPATAIATPLVAALALLAIYFALPGGSGVSGVLTIAPLENAVVVAKWLGSPWLHVLEPLLTPPLSHWYAGLAVDPWVAMVANAMPPGLGERGTASWPGALTVLGGIALVASTWRARAVAELAATWRLGLVLGWFAMGVAGIVSLSRVGYFELHPAQVYANRYLPWACLSWVGLALCWIGAFRPGLGFRFLATAVVVLALALNPTHATWSQIVQSLARSHNVALAAGVFAREHELGETVESEVLNALPRIQAARIGVHGSAAAGMLGSHVAVTGSDMPAINIAWQPLSDRRGGHAWQVDFELPDTVSGERGALWLMVNHEDVAVGLAHPIPRRGRRQLRGYVSGPVTGPLRAIGWRAKAHGAVVGIGSP